MSKSNYGLLENRKENMIVLRLIGGLGNQMSQVAFSYILGKIYQQKVYIDNSSYQHYKIRPCSIQKMKLDNNIIFYTGQNKFVYMKMRISQKIYHVYQYFFGRNKQIGEKTYLKFVKRGHYYNFDSDFYGFPLTFKKNIDIYGYFLGEKYFHDNKDNLKKIFSVKETFISDQAKKYLTMILKDKNAVAISVRLQDDYLKNPKFNVCNRQYFLDALIELKKRLGNLKLKYFIFSDDIERAKALDLPLENVTYIEDVTDVEGMMLMNNCCHYIISNSSFSWWGAYLSKNDYKLVVAPDRWLNNDIDYSSKYYEGVIKINVK